MAGSFRDLQYCQELSRVVDDVTLELEVGHFTLFGNKPPS